jgi:4-hydroxybenzoate polyprenyltransferase
MSLKPYFQLVRLPNVFTAAADSLAGWLLVKGTFGEPERWLPLAGASMAIYAAGIALNDVCDYQVDLLERPNRPLPSGRISVGVAKVLATTLFGLGLLLALISGVRPGAVAALLIGCVLAYNLGLKRTWLGPEVMGACRGLNLALGLSVVPGFGGPTAWLVGASMTVYVIGITWISRSETETGRAGGAAAGMILQDLALVGLFVAAMRAGDLPSANSERHLIPLEGLAVLATVALIVNIAAGGAVREPNPATKQRAVKTGVLSLVWLNVGIVAAVTGPTQALAVAVLWLPAFVLGRWLYST